MKVGEKQLGRVSKVAIVSGIFVLFMTGLWILGGGVQAKEVYEPVAPQAERVYQLTLKANCEAELALTSAKLLDNANNALDLTPEQVGALVAKKQTLKCDF
jgi:hypothetical protein